MFYEKYELNKVFTHCKGYMLFSNFISTFHYFFPNYKNYQVNYRQLVSFSSLFGI